MVTRISSTELMERFSISLLRTAALFVLFAFVFSVGTAAAQAHQNTSVQDMDRSIKPGDDFYRDANGGWLKTTTIPGGQPSFRPPMM